MSEKPICRVQFENQDEFWTLTKVAAQHDQKMPEFLRNCAIKVVNDIFAEQEERNKAALAETETPEAETSTADEVIADVAETAAVIPEVMPDV